MESSQKQERKINCLWNGESILRTYEQGNRKTDEIRGWTECHRRFRLKGRRTGECNGIWTSRIRLSHTKSQQSENFGGIFVIYRNIQKNFSLNILTYKINNHIIYMNECSYIKMKGI